MIDSLYRLLKITLPTLIIRSGYQNAYNLHIFFIEQHEHQQLTYTKEERKCHLHILVITRELARRCRYRNNTVAFITPLGECNFSIPCPDATIFLEINNTSYTNNLRVSLRAEQKECEGRRLCEKENE